MTTRGLAPIILAAATCMGGGCRLRPAPCPDLSTIVPLGKLIEQHNANARMIPQLWAEARIEVSVPAVMGLDYDVWGSSDRDDEANATLLLFKNEQPQGPQDFVLIGMETGIEVFRLGCSTADGAYYFWQSFGEQPILRWGQNKYAGAAGIESLPMDPLQLLAVLGVCELPANFTGPPLVTLSIDTTPGQCAYVVTYIDRRPVTGEMVLKREMLFRWDPDRPRRPFRVNIFDQRGVRVMTADLKDYRPIERPGAPAGAPRPVMPTDISISWPSRRARLHILLSNMVIDESKGAPEACKLWESLPDSVTTQIQVDRTISPGAAYK